MTGGMTYGKRRYWPRSAADVCSLASRSKTSIAPINHRNSGVCVVVGSRRPGVLVPAFRHYFAVLSPLRSPVAVRVLRLPASLMLHSVLPPLECEFI